MAMLRARPFKWRGRLVQMAHVVAPISEQETASLRDDAFFSRDFLYFLKGTTKASFVFFD